MLTTAALSVASGVDAVAGTLVADAAEQAGEKWAIMEAIKLRGARARSARLVGLGAALVVLLLVAGAGGSPGPARANDLANAETVFSTDLATAGLGGLRGVGDGTLTLSGVAGTVTKALL